MSNNAIRSYLQEYHDKMVAHIACLTGSTINKVWDEFEGDYSILIPILARVTGLPATVMPPHIPSPTLQYPERTEDEEDEEEVESLVTPPPVSPLPPYAALPFKGTDIPSPPDSPIIRNSSTTNWSVSLDSDKENWEP
jgi:hypothetical protein